MKKIWSVDLLIENNFSYSFLNRRVVKGYISKPIALDTQLRDLILSDIIIEKQVNKENAISMNLTDVLKFPVEQSLFSNTREEKLFCKTKSRK